MMDRMTTLAQQALGAAQQSAMGAGHPEVSGLHVLSALLEDPKGPGAAIVGRVGADAGKVRGLVEGELGRLPTASSGAGSSGREIMEILAKADASAKGMGDSFVSCEHLLIALTRVGGAAKEVLRVEVGRDEEIRRTCRSSRAARRTTRC